MRNILLFTLLVITSGLSAQTLQYSQFYASPLTLNPALTGSDQCNRFSAIYRDQWPSLPGKFVSYAVAVDNYFPEINSGFGLMINQDRAGTGNLRTTSFNLLYSYTLPINRIWSVRMGMKGNITYRNIDFSSLTFNDQLSHNTATSVEQPVNLSTLYPDFSTGALIYSSKMWLGFSADHITRPNQAFLDGVSQLPVRYSVHAGGKISLNAEHEDAVQMFVSPAVNYRAMGKYDQFDLGCYVGYDPVVLGAWYRGIPILKNYDQGIVNHDALVFMAGLVMKKYRLGYSYDITISKLTNATGGAHEISGAYTLCRKKKKRRINVPCPKF